METKKYLDNIFPDFDADLSWKNPQNLRAAESRNLKYDFVKKIYIDEEGCEVRDEYGQIF